MATAVKKNSRNAANLKVLAAACPMNDALKNISPRWKMQILYSISIGLQQFSQLKKNYPDVSDQILGKRLGELVREGLVCKTLLQETTPSQTWYTTTSKGNALLDIMHRLNQWGMQRWGHPEDK
ncbi:winged helix-turn-helix transcriptional regulator [Chitinophaga nivalis]|uniref:Helix-turn-helix transcriptional regulator n=1 Tax=Chitinophaga nivalis TaxID=2991709 RepID=A0ABT3IKL4_9BACT|nr:helix-turn-helix domain-containing protein [Chitinophaga nivalis]MCW3465822.1 helix-turn-helix transcriptional regulator [Chitinophaga nivalis]MCW3484487.1 helix-turn-helix transcriptional regulator [Chitinophaga nivalis]